MDHRGKQCQVVPRKVRKDTSWKNNVFDVCKKSLMAGVIPDVEVSILMVVMLHGTHILSSILLMKA